MTGLDAVVEAELLDELVAVEVVEAELLDELDVVEAELLELGELVVAEGEVFPKVVKMFPFEIMGNKW